MKNIDEKLAKVEIDKQVLAKAIQLVEEERGRLLALKEEEEKQKEKQKEYKTFYDFTPTAGNVSALVRFVMYESQDLLNKKIITSDSKYIDDFSCSRGQSFSFGEWTIENHVIYGGGEGDGEDHYIILNVTKNGESPLYFKVPGYYTSYDGGRLDFEYTTEVKPVEKPVIFWE